MRLNDERGNARRPPPLARVARELRRDLVRLRREALRRRRAGTLPKAGWLRPPGRCHQSGTPLRSAEADLSSRRSRSRRGKTASPAQAYDAAALGVCRSPVRRLFNRGVCRCADSVLLGAADRTACEAVLELPCVTALVGSADPTGPLRRESVFGLQQQRDSSGQRDAPEHIGPRRDAARAHRQFEKWAAGVPIRGGTDSPLSYGIRGRPTDWAPACGLPEPERPSSGHRRKSIFPPVGRGPRRAFFARWGEVPRTQR